MSKKHTHSGFGYMTETRLPYRFDVISGTTPLTIRFDTPHDIKNITIYGNTINGSGVGEYDPETGLYDIPISITGKNLFSPCSSFSMDGLASQGSAVTVAFTSLRLKPYTAYTCSSNAPKSDYNGKLVDAVFISATASNPSTASNGVSQGRPRTIITSSTGMVHVMIRTIQTYSELIIQPEELINGTYTIQLEECESATDYEPFISQAHTLTSDNKLYYNMKATFKLKSISLGSGTNHLFVNTTAAPSSVKLRYFVS